MSTGRDYSSDGGPNVKEELCKSFETRRTVPTESGAKPEAQLSTTPTSGALPAELRAAQQDVGLAENESAGRVRALGRSFRAAVAVGGAQGAAKWLAERGLDAIVEAIQDATS